MAHIFVKSSVLDFTDYAIYRVVSNENPTVDAAPRQAFPAPHDQRGVTFDNLQPVMHQVQLWESSDGTTLDTLRVTVDVQAALGSELQVLIFDIVIGRGNPGIDPGDTGDPSAGDDTYLDLRMKDQTYQITQRNIGPLRPEDEYIDESATQGGFSLPGGATFNDGDTYFVSIFYSSTVELAPPPNELDIVLEPNNVTLTSGNYGKLTIANGGSGLQTLTFPAFSSIPDKTRMSFSSQYGTYRYLRLLCGSGDMIRFNRSDRTSLYLAGDERIDIIWSGGVAYVVGYEGNAKRRGAIYGDSLVRSGTIAADGTEYTQAAALGLWDWLINDAPAGIKTTYALYNTATDFNGVDVYTNRGKWAVDLVANKFLTPDLRGLFERYVPSDRLAGTYEHFELQAHTHAAKRTRTDPIGTLYEGNRMDSGGDVGLWTGDDVVTGSTGGADTHPANTGKIAVIVL